MFLVGLGKLRLVGTTSSSDLVPAKFTEVAFFEELAAVGNFS
jgi:hypothetical protein